MTYIAPCPNCGTIEHTQYYDHDNQAVWIDIMCWENCGMDFRVTRLWWMLNRIQID